jgi:hypothetical protein
MNGTQLHTILLNGGMAADFEGHVNVLLDTFTGRVLSVAMHPLEGTKSITAVIASCEFEASRGSLLAGGLPTVNGEAWDGWEDVCTEAMEGAAHVATSYASRLYDVIGFSPSKFIDSDAAKEMGEELVAQHLESRLNYAATRDFVNKMVSLSMDMDEADRKHAIEAATMSDAYLEIVEKVLHEVDGQ